MPPGKCLIFNILRSLLARFKKLMLKRLVESDDLAIDLWSKHGRLREYM